MAQHQGLPVAGYVSQSTAAIDLVNEHKVMEERLLRRLDYLTPHPDYAPASGMACDPRWLAIARTHFEEGFMALNRAVFQPQRINGKLPDEVKDE